MAVHDGSRRSGGRPGAVPGRVAFGSAFRVAVHAIVEQIGQQLGITKERVRQLNVRIMKQLRDIAGVLNRLPTAVVTQLFGSMLKGVDFVTSNVPGVPVPVFFAGAALESQVAFGPLTGAATNITLVSYLDDLHIGVNMDRAAIPDRAGRGLARRRRLRSDHCLGGESSAGQGRPRLNFMREERRMPVTVLYPEERQTPDGKWPEEATTGTGFPNVFYLTYAMYRDYFPLMALACVSVPR